MDSNEFFTENIQTMGEYQQLFVNTVKTFAEINNLQGIIATGKTNYIIRGLVDVNDDSIKSDSMFIWDNSAHIKLGFWSDLVSAMGIEMGSREGDIVGDLCVHFLWKQLRYDNVDTIKFDVINGIKCRDLIDDLLDDLSAYPVGISNFGWHNRAKYTYEALQTLKKSSPSLFSRIMMSLDTHQSRVYAYMEKASTQNTESWFEVI